MPEFINVSDVRRRSGIPSKLVTDAQLESFIDEVESEMERWLNTRFKPTTVLEFHDGNGQRFMFLKRNPVLSVRDFKIEDTSITPASLHWWRGSGKVSLSGDAEEGLFKEGSQNVKARYLYGFVKVDESVQTSLSADAAAGTDVSLSVSSINGFSDGDWVEIVGMDGNREAAQVNATPSGSTIQVDEVVKAHESGSLVYKLTIPEPVKVYMEIEAAIAANINAVGATYTFNTNYSLGDLSVSKGVPYTHWKEGIAKLLKEREVRKARIKPRFSMSF